MISSTRGADIVRGKGRSLEIKGGPMGYVAGSGGTVTQITSKTTDVTLNKACGEITLTADAIPADTAIAFTLTNSTIAAGDHIIADHVAVGSLGAYFVHAIAAAGSAQIVVRNLSAGPLAEAIVLKFIVLRSATT